MPRLLALYYIHELYKVLIRRFLWIRWIVDCGLFAIAFAYEIASGNRVLKDSNFDQMKMRVHLLECLENEEITAFPRSRKASKLRQRNHELQVIQTFCTCNMPEAYDDMIRCDLCDDWFHVKCVNLSSTPAEDEEWLCLSCVPPKKLRKV